MIPGIVAGGELSPPSVLWTPAQIATALWLDADDSATITIDTGVVSQWADKSGNARHAANANAGNRPAVSIGGLGSKDAINFAGSEKYLQVPRGFITSAFSAFIVHSGGTDDDRLLDQRGTGAFGTVKGWHVKTGTGGAQDTAGADGTGGNFRAIIGTSFSTAAQQRAAVFPVSGNMVVHVNGTSVGTTSNGGSTPTDIDNLSRNIRVGGNAAGGTTQDFTGLIAEVVLLASAADTTTRQLVEGYLAWKWTLGSLPIGHPYKLAAPTV